MKELISVLDFGSEKITLLLCRPNDYNKHHIFAIEQVDYAGFFHGELLEPELIQEKIATLLEKIKSKYNLKIKKVFLGVPSAFTCVKINNFIKRFDRAVALTEKDICSFSQNKIILPGFTQRKTLLLQATVNEKNVSYLSEKATSLSARCILYYTEDKFVDKIMDILKANRIKVENTIMTPLACSNLITNDNEYSIIVDCGHISTAVFIKKYGLLISNSEFSMGGGMITTDLMAGLKIKYEVASFLKNKILLNVIKDDDDKYEFNYAGEKYSFDAKFCDAIVRARIEVICKGIVKCLNYSQIPYDNKAPIFLTGGGIAKIYGGADFVENYLSRQVSLIKGIEPDYEDVISAPKIALLYSIGE